MPMKTVRSGCKYLNIFGFCYVHLQEGSCHYNVMRIGGSWLTFKSIQQIPIYMLVVSRSSIYRFIVQQLEGSERTPTNEGVGNGNVQAPSTDVDLRGLEAYDLRYFGQPTRESDYDYDYDGEGSKQGGKAVMMMIVKMLNLMEIRMREDQDCNESLVDSNEDCVSNDGCEANDVLNVELEDGIPRHIDADVEDVEENKSASYLCVVEQLLINFKVNPTMTPVNMHKLITESYVVAIPRYSCNRAKKLLKSWVDRKIKSTIVTEEYAMSTIIKTLVLNILMQSYTLLFWMACNADNKHVYKYKPLFTVLEEIRKKLGKTMASKFKLAKLGLVMWSLELRCCLPKLKWKLGLYSHFSCKMSRSIGRPIKVGGNTSEKVKKNSGSSSRPTAVVLSSSQPTIVRPTLSQLPRALTCSSPQNRRHGSSPQTIPKTLSQQSEGILLFLDIPEPKL
ncbi:LOW QUALITY PROTEIN: hypothetical protein Cgig2_032963 [Carnegiea gigantea]|uniref:Uncharacterized protein n=1 Tax=Carnegiea gigantea TaxID=171969 RepID=A0A9Q1QAL2_9CARY|nr:LOW QUALITY PROTEIN: hypothetical protein Cgig2_032963 [Carnegiea gigantea]